MQANQETTLDITGMSCGACVRHVSAALGKLAGVAKVDVQLAEGKARVVHDPAASPVAALIAAIDDAGYEARVAG